MRSPAFALVGQRCTFAQPTGYDAVQLAVALRYYRFLMAHQLKFVSGDNALITAAQVEGLPTDNPFEHVAPADTAGRST